MFEMSTSHCGPQQSLATKHMPCARLCHIGPTALPQTPAPALAADRSRPPTRTARPCRATYHFVEPLIRLGVAQQINEGTARGFLPSADAAERLAADWEGAYAAVGQQSPTAIPSAHVWLTYWRLYKWRMAVQMLWALGEVAARWAPGAGRRTGGSRAVAISWLAYGWAKLAAQLRCGLEYCLQCRSSRIPPLLRVSTG